eukprot:scaffold10297_cov113-Isochrysis_galbana.AAC.2
MPRNQPRSARAAPPRLRCQRRASSPDHPVGSCGCGLAGLAVVHRSRMPRAPQRLARRNP